MAIRQSIIDMYGEVSDGLQRLAGSDAPQARRLRTLGRELAGLTGSAAEQGWHEELVRYFNAHPVGSEAPVERASIEVIYGDITGADLLLPPSWSYHAIVASYLLWELDNVGLGPPPIPGPGELLDYALAASPQQTSGMVEQVRIDLEAGLVLGEQLRNDAVEGRIERKEDFVAALARLGQLSTAVKTNDTNSRLRKVKQEYCSVVSTSATWDTMSYTALKDSITPANWPRYYGDFFCEMMVYPNPDPYGWTRIRESVSGECDRYRLRTGLRFWGASSERGLFLNFDMDPERDDTTDRLVLVDNGYIWIAPKDKDNPEAGVTVQTSKQLLISGMSATALAKLAETLGYTTNANDMFLKAVAFQPEAGDPPLTPWADSQTLASAPPDTSTTWKVVVPELPPLIRDEMCHDTTEFLKDRLTQLNGIATRFGERWEDGIDVDEFDKLADEVGQEVTNAAKEGFDLATSNFRPKPTQP